MPSTTCGVRSFTTPNTWPTLPFSLIAAVMPATAVPSQENRMFVSGCAVSSCSATSTVFEGSPLSKAVATTFTLGGQVALERVDDHIADPAGRVGDDSDVLRPGSHADVRRDLGTLGAVVGAHLQILVLGRRAGVE